MGGWKSIRRMIDAYSERIEMDWRAKHSTYKPEYDGHWVNKGTFRKEKWVWVEDKKVKNIRPYYISVFNLADDYIIITGIHYREDAETCIQCEDLKEVESAKTILKAMYSVKGNVIIQTDIEV